jgi:hypothetical protein
MLEEFTYLSSVLTVEREALQDVKMWIKKANGMFVELYPFWKNKSILMKKGAYFIVMLNQYRYMGTKSGK